MSQRLFNPAPQFFYSGTPAAPLSGGLLYFYEPGTLTPKDTFSDNALTVANANPVILTASGVIPNIFLDGSYDVVLTDKNGVQQPGWPRNNVNSIQDLVFGLWDATFTYGEGGTNIVTAQDGNYYISIQPNNLAHEPTVSALWWQLWPFPSLVKGTVFVADGDEILGLTPSMNGQALISNSGTASGLEFVAAAFLAATQAEMEAAASNTVTATPLNTKWHPGVAKFWLNCNGAGTVINASHNITALVDTGPGQLGVTIDTDFSSANYAISAQIQGGATQTVRIFGPPTAGAFALSCVDSSSGSSTDPTLYFASGFGDQ